MAEEVELVIPEALDGVRLDRALSDVLEGVSRSRVQALLSDGCVRAGGGEAMAEAKRKVRAGETFVVTLPDPAPAAPEPQDIPLDVVFEDEHLIIINKPRGLVVHPAAGNPDGTLVNALLHHCGDSLSGIGGVARPGIVHRLDKDTSGLMVAAKTDAAHQGLSEQFKAHSLERGYQALAWGVPNPARGTIEGNIGRDAKNRKRMAVVARGGKTAVTHYETLEVFDARLSLISCRLETGRTHQIRVHMASIGHSLVGDPLYGRPPRGSRQSGRKWITRVLEEKAQVLHAYMIGFSHPVTGEEIYQKRQLPIYFNELISFIRDG